MEKDSIFRKVCAFLKENAECEYPIKIRRVKLSSKFDGLCEFKGDHFLIKISKNLESEHMIDVLIHEVAHAMSWGMDKDIHGPSWGLAYSKIYRKFLKDFVSKI